MGSREALFKADPGWTSFAHKNGYLKEALPVEAPVVELDLPTNRKQQTVSEAEWTKKHPLSSVGYTSLLATAQVRDGAAVSCQIVCAFSTTWPVQHIGKEQASSAFLSPMVDGWVQGTHVIEEAWLLWPLYEHFDLCMISVEYRLAPEHKFPTWMGDCWDVLEQVISSPDGFLANFNADAASTTTFDFSLALDKLILAGSSAGAGCSAYLSRTCRDKGIPIYGVILNVPVLCDYRHHPPECTQSDSSYAQCTHAFMSSGVMRAVWDLTLPSPTAGSDPKASPLLGDLQGLPRHAIFVAGQDPLRDEGLAYAEKLRSEGVDVQLFVYPGVPHVFAEFWELEATQRFWGDIRGVCRRWLD